MANVQIQTPEKFDLKNPHMKKFADICYVNVHGKIGSWNNHVNTFAIDWIIQVTNFYVYLCFLAHPSTASNFLDIDQEVQLFAIILIPTSV